jgi:hypothetical protein
MWLWLGETLGKGCPLSDFSQKTTGVKLHNVDISKTRKNSHNLLSVAGIREFNPKISSFLSARLLGA